MKKIILLLSVFLVVPFLMPTTAEARHGSYQRIVSYHPCGAPVYQIREFRGYDHCGTPIYRSYTRSNCRCRSHSNFHRGHHHRSHGYSYCPPPRNHHSSHGSVSFFWGR
jgi:hypothetical protein